MELAERKPRCRFLKQSNSFSGETLDGRPQDNPQIA